jgi:hypothetical protein
MIFSFGTPEKVVFEKERCGDLLQTNAYINGQLVKEKLIEKIIIKQLQN